MSKKSTLYIAYGSNLNLEQMTYRCPTAKVAGTAQLKGYELLFRGGKVRGGCGAVATVEPKEGASVPVLVWNIREKDELALDRYEGYPYFYRKEQMEVELNGRSVSAMLYVMNPGHELGLPSDSYYQTIAGGYKSAGFDLAVLDVAVVESYNRSVQEEPEMEQSKFAFASELETMVSNPSPEMTKQWEDFVHATVLESYGSDAASYSLYCENLITEMCNIQFEYGQNILDQLYETGGVDSLDLSYAAEYLAQGGDPNMLDDLFGAGHSMRI